MLHNLTVLRRSGYASYRFVLRFRLSLFCSFSIPNMNAFNHQEFRVSSFEASTHLIVQHAGDDFDEKRSKIRLDGLGTKRCQHIGLHVLNHFLDQTCLSLGCEIRLNLRLIGLKLTQTRSSNAWQHRALKCFAENRQKELEIDWRHHGIASRL
jgi:hypothetical protein